MPLRIVSLDFGPHEGGSNGILAPPKGYLKKLKALLESYGILLVCDEVQAAFGRTGTLWAFEHYGIVPDLSTWGKGISSSLPISCVIGRAEVMDLLKELHKSGSTICMVTHDSRYASHADREVHLFDGKVVDGASLAVVA